jgi:glycosyltransferase involved in cell wall biosynthesis
MSVSALREPAPATQGRAMRILVYPAHMEIGGSQMNAVELAHGVAERGHEVVMFGPDGALTSTVKELGLEYVRAPREHRWPSPRNMRRLRRLVGERGIDIVHAYEWGPCLDLAFGPHAKLGTPLVTTVLSMSVPAFLPEHAPLVVGTPELADEQRRLRSIAHLIEPPIDTVKNAPTGRRGRSRERFGCAPDEVVLAIVCRLTSELFKLDGVLEAIEVVERIGADHPIRLLVVGDGPGLGVVADRAAEVNRLLRRPAVSAVGGMLDPRDAYDAADVVFGHGSSALKGMAFAKPLVVHGRKGFWRLVDESSLQPFLDHGWWGMGDGDGPGALQSVLEWLLVRRDRWEVLGRFGRRVVEERYSLEQAIDAQIDVYRQALAFRPSPDTARRSLRRTAVEVAKYRARTNLVRFDLRR